MRRRKETRPVFPSFAWLSRTWAITAAALGVTVTHEGSVTFRAGSLTAGDSFGAPFGVPETDLGSQPDPSTTTEAQNIDSTQRQARMSFSSASGARSSATSSRSGSLVPRHSNSVKNQVGQLATEEQLDAEVPVTAFPSKFTE